MLYFDLTLSIFIAVCVMEALIAATSESQEVTYNTLATKADFSALKVQLNEKMFNSSLK